MDDSILTILLDKLNQKHVLPDTIDSDAKSLITLAELLYKTVDSDRFLSWCKFSCSVVNNIVSCCLKNGYAHASLTVNSSLAQSCFNELMFINSTNSNLQDLSLLESIKAFKVKKVKAPDSTSIIKNNLSLNRSETCEESQKHSSSRINNPEHYEDSTNSDSDNEPVEPSVCKRPALGNRFPDQVIKRRKHNEEKLIKKAVNAPCLCETSDESEELFKPSTSRKVVTSKNPAVRIRRQKSVRKKPANRIYSSADSDSSISSPEPKPKSRSHFSDAILKSNRALQTDSESSPSTKNQKDDIKSKPSKSKTDKTANSKNKMKQKESYKPKGKPINTQSSRESLKQTANKQEDSSKSKTKSNVKKNGKKLENNNEETLDEQGIECASSSKFVERLKQLESSVLKGTPDPLDKNKTIKKNPTTKSQKNNSEVSKSIDTANSKTKLPSKNTRKSPAVKTQKKPANKKTPIKKTPTKKAPIKKAPAKKTPTKKAPIKKAPAKKAPTKKSQKLTSKSEENIESTVSKSMNELNNREKTDIAKDKNGPVASNQIQTTKPDSADVSVKEDKNDPESFFSSEEDSELDSEPELGTLSACMNSIKRKIPRQTGTATPPLKIFLSSMCDAQSDILDSEGSSFTNVPLKLDDKNVVKRMAKANKPKETVKQDFSVKKLTKTPEALKKIMKLKNKCNAESNYECSSFSDDD